jgi:cytochrome oxidase Cu insertion factor (SCO1/SenC/PrrC family)
MKIFSQGVHTESMRLYNFRLAICLCLGVMCMGVLGVMPVLAADVPAPPESLAVVNPSTPVPTFELPHAQGTTMRSADLQGKIVVVRFWATW